MARVRLLFVIWVVCFRHTARGIFGVTSSTSHGRAQLGKIDVSTNFINESVPAECEEKGLCEKSQKYPKTLVDNLIKEMQASNITLDSDVEEMGLQNRFLGYDYSRINPCKSQSRTIIPLMIRGYVDGKWFYVVNSIENPIQIYKIQKCIRSDSATYRNDGSMECDKQLILKAGYKSQCIQKYMTRKTYVVMKDKAVPIIVKIPTCCTCVGVVEY